MKLPRPNHFIVLSSSHSINLRARFSYFFVAKYEFSILLGLYKFTKKCLLRQFGGFTRVFINFMCLRNFKFSAVLQFFMNPQRVLFRLCKLTLPITILGLYFWIVFIRIFRRSVHAALGRVFEYFWPHLKHLGHVLGLGIFEDILRTLDKYF